MAEPDLEDSVEVGCWDLVELDGKGFVWKVVESPVWLLQVVFRLQLGSPGLVMALLAV